MLTLFHPFPVRVVGLLAREITSRNWQQETHQQGSRQSSLLDSINRQLLGGGLILQQCEDSTKLFDAEGTLRWEGQLQSRSDNPAIQSFNHDGQLKDLIGSRLEDWRLVKVADLSQEELEIRATPMAARPDAIDSVVIRIATVRSEPPEGLPTEAVLIEIDYQGAGDVLALQLMTTLTDCGGVRCPWPFMLLAQRAAAATGWVDAERMWNGRDRWADVVRVLVQLLRGIRDDRDPACVQEARTLLNHLRIMIDLGRKLQGKAAKPERHRGLKELRDELETLRSLDILCEFLQRGATSLSEHWVGVPGVIASCPDWNQMHTDALLSEVKVRRSAELGRLRDTNRYISDPDTIIELSATWPPFPRIERTDTLVRGRWQANLDKRIRKLTKEIADLDEARPEQEKWLEIRRRCRKIGRVIDACSDWAQHKELSFFRRMTQVWYQRLGELEAMQWNIRALSAIATTSPEPLVAEAATWLVRSMSEWLAAVNSRLHRTIPALSLSARNARKKLA